MSEGCIRVASSWSPCFIPALLLRFFLRGWRLILFDLQCVVKWYCRSKNDSENTCFENGELNYLIMQITKCSLAFTSDNK